MPSISCSALARSQPDLDATRVKAFLEKIKPSLEIAARRVLAPVAPKIDAIHAAFGASKFSVEKLVKDAKEFLAALNQQGTLSPQANALLILFGRGMFEHRLISAIINSPLTALRAVQWRSFVTAIESESGLEFPMLSQVTIAVNMADTIAKHPEIGNEICPNLPKLTIAFILKNFKVEDPKLPERLDPAAYLTANGIKEVLQSDIPYSPSFADVVVSDLDVQRWKTIVPPPAAVQQFTWIKV